MGRRTFRRISRPFRRVGRAIAKPFEKAIHSPLGGVVLGVGTLGIETQRRAAKDAANAAEKQARLEQQRINEAQARQQRVEESNRLLAQQRALIEQTQRGELPVTGEEVGITADKNKLKEEEDKLKQLLTLRL
ncbi:MAG: hypothetical protein WCR79_05430 [Fusobacterium sp.]